MKEKFNPGFTPRDQRPLQHVPTGRGKFSGACSSVKEVGKLNTRKQDREHFLSFAPLNSFLHHRNKKSEWRQCAARGLQGSTGGTSCVSLIVK